MAHWEDSKVAGDYAVYRPEYPAQLFSEILAELRQHGVMREAMLDVGCGSGQAMLPLAPHFRRCLGVDVSQSQVEACRKQLERKLDKAVADRCSVAVGGASDFAMPADVRSVDLVTVAQAMHWFDMEAFGAQLNKHLRPGGLLVAWTYGLTQLEPQPCNDILKELDAKLMAEGHWPPERRHVDDGFAKLIPLVPYPLIRTVTLNPTAERSLDAFVSYLGTWSGITRYEKATGDKQLLATVKSRMAAHLGPDKMLCTTLPIKVLVFRRPAGAKL